MIDDTHVPDRTATPGATGSSTPGGSATVTEEVAAPAAPMTAAQSRFQTCRWRKPAEAGSPAYCTHRDVLPMAGTTGFNPDSWCPDCTFYKLRRVPRREY
jgi:hypothetical protein